MRGQFEVVAVMGQDLAAARAMACLHCHLATAIAGRHACCGPATRALPMPGGELKRGAGMGPRRVCARLGPDAEDHAAALGEGHCSGLDPGNRDGALSESQGHGRARPARV